MNFRYVLLFTLSIAVIVFFYILRPYVFPQSALEQNQYQNTELPKNETQQNPQLENQYSLTQSENAKYLDDFFSNTQKQQDEEFSNQTMSVLFNSFGDIKSLKLLKYKETGKDIPLELMLDTNQDENYGISFNFFIKNLFFEKSGDGKDYIEFKSSFKDKDDTVYKIVKRYTFSDKEYIIKLDLSLESTDSKKYYPINLNNNSYQMLVSPQIGPAFSKLDGKVDYRKFFYYDKKLKLYDSSKSLSKTDFSYTGIAGKYFAIAVSPSYKPNDTMYTYGFYTDSNKKTVPSSELLLNRPNIQEYKKNDVYYIYAGPKIYKELVKYNNPKNNTFELSGYNFDKIQSDSFFKWLENLLKTILLFVDGIIGNIGWSIVILTFIVKIILLPLNINAGVSGFRMKELAPKIEKIRQKHPDDMMKIQTLTNELYAKEGVSMMGGCFPMVLQFPIFIAMYNLFNYHFELRGASFIPGWIFDLSIPEYVYQFNGFILPVLNWDGIRGLPFLYLFSQLISGFITMKTNPIQSAGTTQGQIKFMTYGIPVIFLFVLYDVPSGLLVYWISQNILTIFQQSVILNPKYLGKLAQKQKEKEKNRKPSLWQKNLENLQKMQNVEGIRDVTPQKHIKNKKDKKK